MSAPPLELAGAAALGAPVSGSNRCGPASASWARPRPATSPGGRSRKRLQLVVREPAEDVERGPPDACSVEVAEDRAAGLGRVDERRPAGRLSSWRRSTRPRCSIRSTIPVALATDTSSASASLPIGSGPSVSRTVRTWRWTMLSEPSSHLRNMPIRSRGFQFVSSSTIASEHHVAPAITQCHVDNLRRARPFRQGATSGVSCRACRAWSRSG